MCICALYFFKDSGNCYGQSKAQEAQQLFNDQKGKGRFKYYFRFAFGLRDHIDLSVRLLAIKFL